MFMKNIVNTEEIQQEIEPVNSCDGCVFYRPDIQACVREHDKEPVERMPWETACEHYWD